MCRKPHVPEAPSAGSPTSRKPQEPEAPLPEAPRGGSPTCRKPDCGHSPSYGLSLAVCHQETSSEMAASTQGHFESPDLAEFAKKQPGWRKLFGQESGPPAEKHSVATQLLTGGVTGWCAGVIFQKVGKLAAAAAGGGFFLLQVVNHTGYIRVDWRRVQKDMRKAKEQLKIRKSNHISTEMESKAEAMVSFVKENLLVMGGFFGGFLLGMAS